MMTEERLTQIKTHVDAYEVCVIHNVKCDNCKYNNCDVCPPANNDMIKYLNELIEEVDDLNDYVDYLKRKLNRTGETYRARV